MYRYVPAGVPAHAPLVLALHGCEEGATDYATGTGWNTFADQGKFYVAYPQQPASNNAEGCFTWWGSGASGIGRSAPEEVSMTEMVAKMEADFSVDASRVFVTGLSAGGAAALMLLADFPDIFAAGGVFAGVPYGCASDLLGATSCMSAGGSRSASAWGALVLGADPSFKGAYPRVSLWAGSSDTVVAPLNLGQEVLQWTDVLGAPDAGTTDQVNGFPHTVHGHRDGGVLVESYSITGMGHGVPVDPSAGCGAASEFFPDEGICSTRLVGEFFGILP
jgi:poly(hydroxyalkanoate) depolymerase family esterase